MTQSIGLHQLTACSIFAVALSGCLIKGGDLEAGLDDDGADDVWADAGTDDGPSDQLIECLMGTEVGTIGTEQSLQDPECGEITCDEGWGHDGEQLEIALTLELDPPFADQPYQPRALGLLENGHVVVAVAIEGAIDLQFFDPVAALGYGGYSIEDLGSTIHAVEIDSQVVYVAHGDDDGAVELRAVSIASQQQLWAKSFAGVRATAIARGGGQVAFALRSAPELSASELVVLDLDGNLRWSQPTVNEANGVAISPSGVRIAVAGETTRIYDAEDGDLLDEFSPGGLFPIYPQAVTFADEDRVITIGSAVPYERFDGWLSGDSLIGSSSWEHLYNRATSWCPDPQEDDEWSAATTELLGDVTTLTDGSLVVVGSENFEGGGAFGSHPWVARFSAEGEFLSSDRGLWDGFTVDSVAAPDGSVFVLIVEGLVTACELPCDPVTQGFSVRKYVP